MKQKKGQSVGAIMGDKPLFVQIREHIALLEQINQSILPSLLPEELVTNCRAICCENGCLTLAVDDSVWLTSLHYHRAQLFKALISDTHLAIERIKYTVSMPDQPITESTSKRRAPLSSQTCHQLQTTARFIEHQGLAAVLKRLSDRQV